MPNADKLTPGRGAGERRANDQGSVEANASHNPDTAALLLSLIMRPKLNLPEQP